MIAVADSSPLIALTTIGHHQLLFQLYGEITAPPAVWEELGIRRDELLRNDLLSAAWFTRKVPANHDLVLSLRQTLGAGEAEAIALALEM